MLYVIFINLHLTVQIRNFDFLPGGLQHLNLEADCNFFFNNVNNILKDAYVVL